LVIAILNYKILPLLTRLSLTSNSKNKMKIKIRKTNKMSKVEIYMKTWN